MQICSVFFSKTGLEDFDVDLEGLLSNDTNTTTVQPGNETTTVAPGNDTTLDPGNFTTTTAPAGYETTTAPELPTTTEGTPAPHNPPAKNKESSFDGASFAGGIALGFGLVIIAGIAFSIYRRRALKRYSAM